MGFPYGGFHKWWYPKSSILMGLSIINHPFWRTPIFGNPYFFDGKSRILKWSYCTIFLAIQIGCISLKHGLSISFGQRWDSRALGQLGSTTLNHVDVAPHPPVNSTSEAFSQQLINEPQGANGLDGALVCGCVYTFLFQVITCIDTSIICLS